MFRREKGDIKQSGERGQRGLNVISSKSREDTTF
jgi:hypothetical protein